MTPMPINIRENLQRFKEKIPSQVTLLAVSKTKPIQLLQEAYDAGQRDFGENKVQELRDKQPLMPNDIRWHMIGHLQTNKVKYIAPFIYMIHAVDSIKLLREIDKRAQANNRTIKVLLQVYIAKEEAKFGFDPDEIRSLFENEELLSFKHICFAGLMGMATNTNDRSVIENEFKVIQNLHQQIQNKYPQFTDFKELSTGMSNDFEIAIENGSSMIRIGSSIFGSR
jgi:pyridoxal phosphate enzyme (YggS family)